MRRAAHAARLMAAGRKGYPAPAMRPLSVVVIAFLACSMAFAQQKPPAPKEDSASGGATAPRPSFRRDASASQALFDRLDKNRDGYLTGTELTSQEALSASWLGVDRDGDGRISREEFTAVPQTASK
jgi:hypothetical protein